MAKTYKNVPISAAKRISKDYDKSQVIVVCWDGVHGRTHITTYGVDKEQCRQAALGGTAVAKALGLLEGSPTEPQEGT